MPHEALAAVLADERAQGSREGADEVVRRARREPVRATALPVAPLLSESERARRFAVALDEMFEERWGR